MTLDTMGTIVVKHGHLLILFNLVSDGIVRTVNNDGIAYIFDNSTIMPAVQGLIGWHCCRALSDND